MKYHSSVVFVKDIEISKKFYIENLNLIIEHDFGKNIIFKCGLAIWELSAQHEIVKGLNTTTDSNRMELYFESDKMESDFSKLKLSGVKFLHEMKEEAWGQRTIRFFDPDKHLIEIGEPLECFVKRFHQNGLSIQEISEKTGIHTDTVKSML